MDVEDEIDAFGYELAPTEFPSHCSSANSTTLATVQFLHTYNIIGWPNFTNCLPICGMCSPSATDHTYIVYNLLVIGILLPCISIGGLFGNGFSAYVYSRPSMRSSTNLYLCALGCSDNAVILTALFLFFLDSVRKYSLRLTIVYNFLSPYVYPAGMIAQTCSVYFTLIAGVDCFIHVSSDFYAQQALLLQVCLPDKWRQCFDSPRTLRLLIGSSIRAIVLIINAQHFRVVVFSVLYNLPHCFESVLVECWHPHFDAWSLEICPSPFRFHETYTLIYYKYLYSLFLAVGPLIALIFLNSCIILFTMVLKLSDADPSDNVALVLVVLLFISCNIIALLINIFENYLSTMLAWRINYIIDLSNLMVVFNSSFNFIIYFFFSAHFRNNFNSMVLRRCGCHQQNGIIQTLKTSPETTLLAGITMTVVDFDGNGATNGDQTTPTCPGPPPHQQICVRLNHTPSLDPNGDDAAAARRLWRSLNGAEVALI